MQKGDWVKRKSYGGDIIFVITGIHRGKAILEGVEYRLIADADLADLIRIEEKHERLTDYRSAMEQTVQKFEQYRRAQHIRNYQLPETTEEAFQSYFEMPGKVLHLDGDQKYLEKSLELYRQLKIPVSGYHVEEEKMPQAIYHLLPKIKPDILVITGHDSILKHKRDQKHSLESYKNSWHFVKAVKVAREYERNWDALSIVAGACQSHFEALLQAGSNFASSPGRIMIHALDPVQIAAKISYTSIKDTVDMPRMIKHTVSGFKGIGGIESRGSYRIGLPHIQ